MVAFHRSPPSRKELYFVKKPFKKTPASEMRQDLFKEAVPDRLRLNFRPIVTHRKRLSIPLKIIRHLMFSRGFQTLTISRYPLPELPSDSDDDWGLPRIPHKHDVARFQICIVIIEIFEAWITRSQNAATQKNGRPNEKPGIGFRRFDSQGDLDIFGLLADNLCCERVS